MDVGRRASLRKILAALFLVVSLGTLGWAVVQRETYQRSSVESRRLNEATVQAIGLKIQESTSMYQITVGFIVALWGLVLAPGTSPRIALRDPEAAMAAASTIMLGAAVVWYYLYSNAVFDAYRVAGATATGGGSDIIPDVFRMQFNHLLVFQRAFLVGGAMMAVVTLFSASREGTS
jgi:hypothetical protein